jgi:hypothetical protein
VVVGSVVPVGSVVSVVDSVPVVDSVVFVVDSVPVADALTPVSDSVPVADALTEPPVVVAVVEDSPTVVVDELWVSAAVSLPVSLPVAESSGVEPPPQPAMSSKTKQPTHTIDPRVHIIAAHTTTALLRATMQTIARAAVSSSPADSGPGAWRR